MTIDSLYSLFLSSNGVSTDTRTLLPGQIFFALKGENFNGDTYAAAALEKGAAIAVVSESCEGDDPRFVRVPDTLETLKALAAHHRRQLDIPVIGLTGTNGKTTTKELIRTVLSVRYKVTATKGNLNNDIGVPLSVLSIGPEAEIAVIEMGANHPDDIGRLTPVSQPDYGLITNVGKAHLLGFGSFEGVKKAKGMLYDYLAEHGGTAFLNVDDPDLTEMTLERHLPVIRYGLQYDNAEILPLEPEHPFLRLSLGGITVETGLVGAYNAVNVLAALAVGAQFGVDPEDGAKAISAYEPHNNRSEMTRTADNTVIADAYNANPSSMKVALDNLEAFSAPRKAVLLGMMGELGAESLKEHQALVDRLSAMNLDKVYLVGEEFRRTGTSFPCFATSADLAAYLGEHPLKGYTILLKGSRSTAMEKILPVL